MLTQKDLDSLDEVMEAYRRIRAQLDNTSTFETRANRDLAAADLTKAWLQFAREVEKNN